MRVASPSVGLHRGEWIRRRGWWGLGASALVAFASWSLMVPLDAFALFVLSLVAGLTGVASALAIAAGSRLEGARTPAEIVATPTEIVVHGGQTTRISLDDVEDGWLAHPHDVHVRTRDGRTLAVDAGDLDTAHALLRAVGVGPSQRVLTVPLSSHASVTFGGVPAAVGAITVLTPITLFLATVASIGIQDVVTKPSGAAVMAGVILLSLVLLLLGVIGGLVGTLRRREAVIGVDGVTVKSTTTKTFVRHADVTQVAPHEQGVMLHRRSGPPLLLPTWDRSQPKLDAHTPPHQDAALRQRVLLERIAEAARATSRAPAAEALARGDRTIADWREHVLSLVRRVGYRETSLTPQHLVALVEDAAAPAEQRIAAAMGLAESDEPALAKRLRIAIETCADEELRAALEHAAAADHEQLERAWQRQRIPHEP